MRSILYGILSFIVLSLCIGVSSLIMYTLIAVMEGGETILLLWCTPILLSILYSACDIFIDILGKNNN